MRLLDYLTIQYQNEPRYIEIYHGDLSAIPLEEKVDLLVVSAFPNDYVPTRGSMIGALYRRGLSVAHLAKNKTSDLREAASCWLSPEIDAQRYGFRRLMCFESDINSEPPQCVGDIFRALWQFIGVGELHSYNVLATPILATGDQAYPLVTMLELFLDAAVKWLRLGLPLERIKIVAYSERHALELKGAFGMFKRLYRRNPPIPPHYHYDVFLSYSHQNVEVIRQFDQCLRNLDSTVQIFLDEQKLDTGCAWQEDLYQAVFSSRLVAAFYSAPYQNSAVCLEEFNLAWTHQHLSGNRVLFPIYLYTISSLSPRLAAVQFEDCREANLDRLDNACRKLLDRIQTARATHPVSL